MEFNVRVILTSTGWDSGGAPDVYVRLEADSDACELPTQHNPSSDVLFWKKNCSIFLVPGPLVVETYDEDSSQDELMSRAQLSKSEVIKLARGEIDGVENAFVSTNLTWFRSL